MTTEISGTFGNKTNGLEAKRTALEVTTLENRRLLAELSSLQQLNREYKSIIHHASHDLLGPINDVVSLVNLMVETKDPEEIDYLSKPVLKAISKFKSSLNELSIFKEREKEPELTGTVNIKTVLNEVTESINSQIIDAGAVLTRSLQVTHVQMPIKHLRNIFFNLISNALKFKSLDRTPAIHVSSFRKGNFVLIAVLDNGTGIRPEKMDKLFTKFGTLHDEPYPGESLGIGLFLLKKLLEESGGKIEAESEWGKGSVFNVYLRDEAASLSSEFSPAT